jgi:hypothetical protein
MASISILSLKIFNSPVQVSDSQSVLTEDISVAKEITLTHNQSVFTLEFALLNYIKSEKNRYAYRLEGFEDDWNYVANPFATYTNLTSGDYKFVVKGANNDGVWSNRSAELVIHVLPPYWKTWWAYMLYILVLSLIIFIITRYFYANAIFNYKYELHQNKLNFFTNVSHEIRTHLTLIQGPVEELMFGRENNQVSNHMVNQRQFNNEVQLSTGDIIS